MKWLTAILLLVLTTVLPNNIAKINKLKSEAQSSYMAGDYQAAVEKYGILVDSFQVNEEEILMNYANAAFLALGSGNSPVEGVTGPASAVPPAEGSTERFLNIAQSTYTNLAQNASPDLQSKALNQLGVMAYQSDPAPRPNKKVLTQAQGLFKSSLKTDQHNQQARFNYELVTKMLDQQEEEQEQQQDQNKDQQQQDQDQQQQQQQEQEQQQQDQQQQQQQQEQEEQQQEGNDQNQEQEGQQENSEEQEGEPQESDQQESDEQQGEEQPQEEQLNASPEKMEELKISEEKARMILEAMKNSEVQYIQQNQKKATKRPDSNKPDW